MENAYGYKSILTTPTTLSMEWCFHGLPYSAEDETSPLISLTNEIHSGFETV